MKESILRRYPELSEDALSLRDDGDGVYIETWNIDKPKPTMDQINQWVLDDADLPKPLSDIGQLKKDQADFIFSLMMGGVL